MGIRAGPAKVRFTMKLNDKGEWVETREVRKSAAKDVRDESQKIGLPLAQLDTFGADVIFGQHIRVLPCREAFRMQHVGEKLIGHLREVGFMADPILRRDRDVDRVAFILHAYPGIASRVFFYSRGGSPA
jgi:hypothetical protein